MTKRTAPESVTLVLVAAVGAGRPEARKRAGVRCRYSRYYSASTQCARGAVAAKNYLVVKQNWALALTHAASVGYDAFIMRRFVLILSSRSGT
jgi:hypothetical protein